MYQLFKDFEKFEQELGTYIIYIGDSIILTPHYVTFPYSLYPIQDEVANCFKSGYYCADPNPTYGIKDGREIINENIKQKCVYNYLNAINAKTDKKDHLMYIKFMNLFYSKCMSSTSFRFDGNCHNEVLRELGIPEDNINKCYLDSFINPDSTL